MQRLGIIGGGNMGQAIVRGGLAAGIIAPSAVIVAEIDPAKRAEIARLGCATSADPAAAALAEQIILAVKPQAFLDFAGTIATPIASKVVISIMAGLHSSRFAKRSAARPVSCASCPTC